MRWPAAAGKWACLFQTHRPRCPPPTSAAWAAAHGWLVSTRDGPGAGALGAGPPRRQELAASPHMVSGCCRGPHMLMLAGATAAAPPLAVRGISREGVPHFTPTYPQHDTSNPCPTTDPPSPPANAGVQTAPSCAAPPQLVAPKTQASSAAHPPKKKHPADAQRNSAAGRKGRANWGNAPQTREAGEGGGGASGSTFTAAVAGPPLACIGGPRCPRPRRRRPRRARRWGWAWPAGVAAAGARHHAEETYSHCRTALSAPPRPRQTHTRTP
jgi:hypothetical protein